MESNRSFPTSAERLAVQRLIDRTIDNLASLVLLDNRSVVGLLTVYEHNLVRDTLAMLSKAELS